MKELGCAVLLVLCACCEAQGTSCGAAPTVKDGEFVENPKESYHSGERVTYRCKKGFVFKKLSHVTCEDSQWTETPECKKEGSRCGAAPFVAYGDITGSPKTSYPSGTTVVYKCQSYYILLGNNKVTCTSGAWSTLPECLEPCTVGEEEMAKNNIKLRWLSDAKLYSTIEEEIEFICLSNDYIKHEESTPFRVKCIRGKLLYPRCIRKGSCTPSSKDMDPRNIILMNENTEIRDGNQVEFTCKPGFYKKLNQNMNVMCMKGKLDYPVCDDSPCQVTKDKLDEHFVELSRKNKGKTAFFKDETISFTCKPRFKVLTPPGIMVANCTEAGFIYPTCYNPDPCRVSEDGTDLHNLELEGEKILFRHGDIIPFKCKNGFFEITSLNGTCKNSNITYPTCVPGKEGGECGPAPSIANGDITGFPQQSYPSGSSVEYKCQSYYNMLGNNKVTCLNGAWSPPPECLEPCTASPEELAENNIAFRWSRESKLYIEHAQSTDFICLSNDYIKDEESPPFRVTCIRGQLLYPRCIKKAPCMVDRSELVQKNIELSPAFVNIQYVKSDERIEFQCKEGFVKHRGSGDMSQICEEGFIVYPTCVKPRTQG